MKKIFIVLLGLLTTQFGIAQNIVSGVVTDSDGNPLEGVLVSVVGAPTRSAITDYAGVVALHAEVGEKVQIELGSSLSTIADVTSSNKWTLSKSDAVITTGLSTEKSADLSTQASSTVTSEELGKNSTVNPLNTLYGLFPGLITLENSGRSTTSPTLKIRGSSSSPLIVIDGFPRSGASLQVNEIESVTVLKDATAATIWGMQGANGVVSITTKRGKYNSSSAEVVYTFGMAMSINEPEMVDGVQYANAVNTARANDGLSPMYTAAEIGYIADGTYPDIYPNVNWADEVFRDISISHQFDAIFTGGGSNARYFADLNYHTDQGVMSETYSKYNSEFDNQMRNDEISLRGNLDIDLTKSTLLKLGVKAHLEEYQRPSFGTFDDYFHNVYNLPATSFPVTTSEGDWGGVNGMTTNPAAAATSGYYSTFTRFIWADLALEQSLESFTEGLSARAAVTFDNSVTYTETNSKTYTYGTTTAILDSTGAYSGRVYETFNYDSSYSYSTGFNAQTMNSALVGQLDYDRWFGDNGVTGSLIYRHSSESALTKNNTYKYQSVILTGGYNYANKYLVDVVANYAGMSTMATGDKMRMLPAISAAWIVSNEDSWDNSTIDFLKVRASVGKSAQTTFGYDVYNQYWSSGSAYYFTSSNTSHSGYGEGTLPVLDLQPEYSTKSNIGVDIRAFDSNLSVTADIFYDRKSNIYTSTDDINSDVIGISTAYDCTGITDYYGAEAGASWTKKVNKDLSYTVGTTLSFARSKIVANNEGPLAEDYLSSIGSRNGQIWGLNAIGFFDSYEEIENSPTQMFCDVQPGDVKYEDRNGDGVVDSNDVYALGYSSTCPEIYYGINLSLKYKGFGVSANFQGTANYSVMLNTEGLYWPILGESNISKWYLEDQTPWSEETKDSATVPRLTSQSNSNNYRASSLWLQSASYFKLRNLEVYYDLPESCLKSIGLNSARVFLRGNNLFSIDGIDYSDCESAQTIAYPDQAFYYVGLNIKF